MHKKLPLLFLLLCSASLFDCGTAEATRVAIIGDFGQAGDAEAAVATLVKSWNPEIILALGDNNYEHGAASTIDANIGQYYHDYIGAYKGSYGAGSLMNRFFPALGNHDWETGTAQPSIDYFDLPGNERYYDFQKDGVDYFVLDSDPHEPDGITATSTQGTWLKNKLQSATGAWQIVYMHHPPYSSGQHGSTKDMQWPYKAWGVDLVLAGHDHDYERLAVDGLPYIVNGVGGNADLRGFDTPVPGSLVRYNAEHGAILMETSPRQLTLKFFNKSGTLIDTFVLNKPLTVTSPQKPKAAKK